MRFIELPCWHIRVAVLWSVLPISRVLTQAHLLHLGSVVRTAWTRWLVLAATPALLAAALSQWAPYAAYRRLGDLEWFRTASAQALRENAHQALGFWFGDPHDAFIILGEFGDKSSIPYLETALADEPSDDDGLECTWWHGRAALARLTDAAQAK